jgi:hypothetical protein
MLGSRFPIALDRQAGFADISAAIRTAAVDSACLDVQNSAFFVNQAREGPVS